MQKKSLWTRTRDSFQDARRTRDMFQLQNLVATLSAAPKFAKKRKQKRKRIANCGKHVHDCQEITVMDNSYFPKIFNPHPLFRRQMTACYSHILPLTGTAHAVSLNPHEASWALVQGVVPLQPVSRDDGRLFLVHTSGRDCNDNDSSSESIQQFTVCEVPIYS